MNKELLAALLPILIQYSVTAAKDIIALIEGNPQGTLTDAEYLAKLSGIIDANTASIDAQDAAIQQ